MKMPDLKPKVVELDLDYANKLLGMQFTKAEAKRLLEKMRHGVEVQKDRGNKLKVLVPAYRTDILHPIDLVEDMAIAYGYENFKPEIPQISTVGNRDSLEKFTETIRELMIGAGFQEVMTLIMTNRNNVFTKMMVPDVPVVEAEKAVSSEHSICRNWLLPSLLFVLEKNKNKEYPQMIFEAGDCILSDGKQERKLAGVIAHSKTNYSDTKAVIAGLMQSLGLEPKISAYVHGSFIEGRCAKTEYGFFGEVSPQVLENYGLEVPVSAFEFDLSKLRKSIKA